MGLGNNGGTGKILLLEYILEVNLREVAACINTTNVFSGGIWLRSQMLCMNFVEKHIPEGQFHWFIYIISYL